MAFTVEMGFALGSTTVEVGRHKYDRRNGTKRLIIFCHGAGAGENIISASTYANQGQPQAMADLLNTGRYTIVNIYGGSSTDTWGSDAAADAVEAARVWGQGAAGGAAAGKFALVCWSMGNATAFAYARKYGITNLAGIFSCIPVGDLDWNRGTDAAHGGAYAAINTAFGVANDAAWNAIKSTVNPVAFAATAPYKNKLPWTTYYHSDDSIEPVAQNALPLAAAVGTTAKAVNKGTGNHTWCATGPELIAELEAFNWS